MFTQKSFYKSKQWESFRKVIIDRDTASDGFVYCAQCGKPIIKKYDLIVHHKKELSDANVNDYSISLNPDNVECVHFQCHNQIHERFGYGTGGYKPTSKKVYIVYGSPCAGKSTWVHKVAGRNDLIVDMDSIWQMVGTGERYDKPDALRSVVFGIRDKLYDMVKYRDGRWQNAYIITGGALRGDRERLMTRVGADELVYIDTSQEECINRLDNDLTGRKKKEWLQYINDWFDQYQP